ncbi:MAG: alcohol dehydrogenase catalytic domain-containing protein, partial [Myxococcota bacterium]
MNAILQTGYGDPERVLSWGAIEAPIPGDDEVLVEVRATSVNTPDWIAVTGVPYALRPAMGLGGPRSLVRGSDVAGIVLAVGRAVQGFAPGDAVYGSVWTGGFGPNGPGTFAERTVAPARHLA